jgi:hypothetical protein
MTVRAYISGPMSGLPDFNHPAFHACAERLRTAGFDVVNPAEINPVPIVPRAECMRRDIEALLTCDVIVMLQGWEKSRGAVLEMMVATEVGIHPLCDGGCSIAVEVARC